MEIIKDGSVTSPRGFRAAGIAAGIKKTGAPDVALLVSDVPAPCAAMFTQNLVQAAPIAVCKEHLNAHGDSMRAIVINSGNANAVTGQEGLANARKAVTRAATELGLEPGQVLVMSTGVIGVQLPISNLLAGISTAVEVLSNEGGHDAARAIMTTDTRPKEIAVRVESSAPDSGFVIGGMCKGAGMIHPNMATMLAVITTDANVPRGELQEMLKQAVDDSFNCISVDGDTSTNDSVALLANGLSGVRPERETFQSALTFVCRELAKMVVKDGEGATKLVTITVSGARSEAEAKQIASTIATSMLVKTAIYGRDANWGRVLAAAGRSGAWFDPQNASLRFGNLPVLKDGTPLPFSEEEALKILSADEIEMVLELGVGQASATMWTCDLTHEYVSINAEYRT